MHAMRLRLVHGFMAVGSAVLAVGIALAISIAVPPLGTPSLQLRPTLGDNANLLVFSGVGWTALHPIPPSLAASLVNRGAVARPTERSKSAFSWSAVLTDIDADDTLQEVGFGLPFRCLSSRVILGVDHGAFHKRVVYGVPFGEEHTAQWVTHDSSHSYFPIQQLIPLHLWWPGLLGNAAIYWLFAFFVGLLWNSVRARWRIHHGCCGHCGYPSEANRSQCPECGTVCTNTSRD